MIKSLIDDKIIGCNEDTGRIELLEKMVSYDDIEEFLLWVSKTLRATVRPLHQLPVESMISSFQAWMQDTGEIGGMCRIEIGFDEIRYSFGMIDKDATEIDPQNGLFKYEQRGRIIFNKGKENDKESVHFNRRPSTRI